jgi:hypothetical protein
MTVAASKTNTGTLKPTTIRMTLSFFDCELRTGWRNVGQRQANYSVPNMNG